MEETTRKKAQKATPSGSENDGATQNNENTLDSNIHLCYDVLRIIFRHLNARDLARVTMVCRLWLEAANDEKRSRGPCHCIINRDKMDDLINYIKNIRINPSIGFFFLPDDISCDVEDLIYDLLPKHCEVIILYCPQSIIVLDEELRMGLVESLKSLRVKDARIRKKNLEFAYYKIDLSNLKYRPLPNIVCAFLPQIPNIRIESYKETSSFMEEIDIDPELIINEIVNFVTSMSNHKISKTYVMLFCKRCGNSDYVTDLDFANISKIFRNSQENKIASICGSLMQDICASYITSDNVRIINRSNFIAVAITGSIQTWSTCFKVRTFRNINEQIEVQLNLFKDKVKLKRHSIGFMFTKIGTEIYEQAIVEQEIFKRLFPKVPLVVCYNYDQFCEEIFGEEIEVDKDEEDEGYSITRCYIVFMILTYD